jgi:hypothetical protein
MKCTAMDECGNYFVPSDLFFRSNGINVWITTKVPLEQVQVNLIYNKSA